MVASPRPPDDEVPVSIEPIVGWRVWRLMREGNELRLRSVAFGGSWTPRVVEPAVCARYSHPGQHAAPQRHCTCGYYAADSWGSLIGARVFHDGVGVVGAIGQWGTVIEHGAGARSEFAYPARLRLVCGPCLKGRAVRDPAKVVDSGGHLIPMCAKHAGGASGLPADVVEWELLNTYGVELLPKPTIPRRRRWGLTFDKGVPKPAQVGMWAVTAVFMVIRVLISIFFTLWLIGLALMVGGAILGGIYNLFTHGGPVETPAPSVSVTTETSRATSLYRIEQRRFGGAEPHRGVPPVPPPPRLALPCGVGRGDHVELVACSDPLADLLGVARQTDPRGVARDCVGRADAYTSGPHWYACWFAPLGAWIVPRPTSPNPFVHPLGGAFDGDR